MKKIVTFRNCMPSNFLKKQHIHSFLKHFRTYCKFTHTAMTSSCPSSSKTSLKNCSSSKTSPKNCRSHTIISIESYNLLRY
ncbi:hypothetical protein SORBI_3004G242800 [Sorghum bicolor]|uniref:Uncharacterized protein n=1 Tax=Sorghum bicolor TaxID=4558 RepID=A0A194YRC9_SORBI|nr:hypothetical protein SORBI_3004G242800 [Sorghum bicolor]